MAEALLRCGPVEGDELPRQIRFRDQPLPKGLLGKIPRRSVRETAKRAADTTPA